MTLCVYTLVVVLISALAVYMPGATFIAPGFVLYIFTNVGIYSFVVPTGRNITVDVLIVAGGGGGGAGITTAGMATMSLYFLSLCIMHYFQVPAVAAQGDCSLLLVK